jgi:PAS domain S-box-containing protein
MNLPNPKVKPLPSANALQRVDAPLKWLVGIFLLCLLLVFGLRGYFADMENELKERGANERARLFVGEEIVRGIQGVEKDVYSMALTQNSAGFLRINHSVNAQLKKLKHDLNVLQTGGISRRQMQLNVDGKDDMAREAQYTPTPKDQSVVMALLEIEPQLDQVRIRADALEQLLERRWQTVLREDRSKFYLIEEEIALFLKQIPPYFERLDENANRLFLEGEQRMRAIQSEIEERTLRLKQVETTLIALVLILGGASGVLFMRRLSSALLEARTAKDDIEHQRAQNATMLDTLGDGVYATDMQGIVRFINTAGERILGWSANELVGQHAHLALHHTRPNGSHFPKTECPLIDVLHQGVSLDGEEHFVAKSGRFIPVSYRSKPLFKDGQITGSLVSFQDISGRLESEARIRLQQAALDAAANMIVITNRDGIIKYVNPAFCKVTGFTLAEIIEQPASILNSGLQDSAFYQRMWQTLLNGQAWEGELSNRRKNGEIYSEQMTITPIVEDAAITYFVAIKRDISDEIRTRTRLKLVEKAIQEIDQGIHIMEAQPHVQGPLIQYVNAGYSRITGYSYEEAVGQRAGFIRGNDSDPQKLKQITSAMSEGANITLEQVYQRKDGSHFTGELHLSPVHNDTGEVSHYIGLLSDIDLRKQAEAALHEARDQALENSRLKSEFLSNMSHEIRTPMNGIIGMTDLLLDTQLDPEQRDFTGIVRDSAQALLVIINDILDFSKIEAGKLEIEVTDFSTVQVVEGSIELLTAKAHEKGLTLASFSDPNLPPRLRGDPTRLRQVLLNLISNAIKFTDKGSVELSAMPVQLGNQSWLRFEVHDTGIGISPSVQAKLFQSFTQADSSTTRKYGGTGLGLAICKRLVELMGGQIGIQSSEGQGSNFWFTVPLEVSNTPDPHSTEQRRQANDATDLRVLVVDDHASDRKIIHRYLASWGLMNDGASNAAEALKLMRDAIDVGMPYNLAMVDYVMPGMNGIELAQTLRSDPKFAATRLVLMSAHDQRELFERALESGFADCLHKPIRQSQLFDSLNEHPFSELADSSAALELLVSATPNLHNSLENRCLILLAEDNLINQKVAQLQINKLGYALHIVGNGQEAVQAIETAVARNVNLYSAVLMDCQMPVLDGFEATALIRKSERNSPLHIPIIAMTANAMQGDRERCLGAGMDDYLSKPINPSLLQNLLEKWAGPPLIDKAAITPHVVQLSSPEAAPAQSSRAVGLDINFELLNDYFGEDPGTITKLLMLFESTTTVLLEKLVVAMAQRNATSVHALAHELKGSCGNIGIERMALIAADLELAATACEWSSLESLQPQLSLAFVAVRQAIASHSISA